MGTEVYVVCVKCQKVRALGKWKTELPEAIALGSKAVKEYSKTVPMNESYWQVAIEKALEFASEHTDKKHKVIVAVEG